jgi:hypothetical protein
MNGERTGDEMTTKTKQTLTHYGEIETDASMGGPFKIILCGDSKARRFTDRAREVDCPKCLAAIAAEGDRSDPGPLSDDLSFEIVHHA